MTSEGNARKFAFVLWVVLFTSIGMYYLVIQLIPAGEPRGGRTELYLGIASGLLALFSVAARLRRREAAGPEEFKRYLLLGSVPAEACALMGVVAHIVTGWPHAWMLIVLGGAAHPSGCTHPPAAAAQPHRFART